MQKIKFDPEQEMQVVGSTKIFPMGKSGLSNMIDSPKLNTPISPKENYRLLVNEKAPLWMPFHNESFSFNIKDFPDNTARAFVSEAADFSPEERGGRDWFDIEWEYMPEAGGSMVAPGNPKVKDLYEWENYITFPDLDKIDWDAIAERNEGIFDADRSVTITQFSGLFERLISFVDFEEAALAMIDEDGQEAVHRLFDKLCTFYMDLVSRCKEHFPFDIYVFHDDWGSQRAPFFSLETCREMLVPYVKKLVDHCHSLGIIFNFHSCGKSEMLVPAMIEAGIDIWVPQSMNDVVMLLVKHGDAMCFGASPALLKGDASDDEIEKAAADFVEKYKGHKNMVCFPRGEQPSLQKLCNRIYALTREAYNS